MEEEQKHKNLNPADILRYDSRSKKYFYLGNLIANSLEIEGYANTQIYDDIFTTASEALIREKFGCYTYSRPLEELPKINEQLERAVDPTNKQIPFYEFPRNYQNYINNSNLLHARFDETSMFHSAPYLEVSPPPKSDSAYINEQIRQRGYTEDSYILVSLPDTDEEGNRSEKAIQLWTKEIDEFEWHNFFDTLSRLSSFGEESPPEVAGFPNPYSVYQEQFGADVIARSGFMNEAQLLYLQNFLNSIGHEVNLKKLSDLEKVKKQFKLTIKERFDSDLQKIIVKSTNLECFDWIEEDLQELSKKLVSLNQEFKLYLRDLMDDQVMHSRTGEKSFTEFARMTDEERYRHVEEIGFDIRFCGGNMTQRNTMLGQQIGFGSLYGKDKYGDLEFECPNPTCGKVNVREKNQLIEKCKHCGCNVRCD